MNMRLPWLGIVAVIALPLFSGNARAVDCATIPGNLAVNCGFESDAEVATWGQQAGIQAFTPAGENGGSMRGDSADFSGIHVFSSRSPCIAVTPGQSLDLGYAAQAIFGSTPSCTAGWHQYADAACTLANSGSIGSTPTVVTGSGFSAVSESHTVDAGTGGFRMSIDCRSTSSAFVARFDNAFIVLPSAGVSSAAPVPALGLGALAALAVLLSGLGVRRLGGRGR